MEAVNKWITKTIMWYPVDYIPQKWLDYDAKCLFREV